MPRPPRQIIPDAPYHVLNRSNGRFRIFERDDCYHKFCRLIDLACDKHGMEILAFCIMPNHWHLILRPRHGTQLSQFMRWLSNTHTRRYHVAHHTVGQGPVYQGRYKAILLADDRQLSTTVRYVERNAVAANLVSTAAAWPWSSASPTGRSLIRLSLQSFQMEGDWQQHLHDPLTALELTKSVGYQQ